MARTPPITDATAVRHEIERLSALSLDDLRAAWRAMFRKPGKGLSRQLLLRTLAWEVQERAFGGYDKDTEAALRRYANGAGGSAGQKRYLQAGTVLVREYQGTRHTVTVAPEGFIWQGSVTKACLGSPAPSPAPSGMAIDSLVFRWPKTRLTQARRRRHDGAESNPLCHLHPQID